MPFDRKLFNTDPKFQDKRDEMDALTEDSINRILARKAAEAKKPAPTMGFFESLFADNPAGGGESFWDTWFK